jgi:aminomuconate-semialdehyde/2-hydroxymuconate-6-semialdehyde dehydrogenase
MERILNYIGGAWKAPAAGLFFPNIDPSRGEIYGEIPDSDEQDIEEAVKAALAAFPKWAATDKEQRSKIMLRIADLIEENLNSLALAESIDNGKPISLSGTVDIPRASQNFSFFAKAITQFHSEAHAMESGYLNYTLRQPIGVVGCISPWNLPLYLFTWKIAPAIAAGNCVVAKPSEITPMTAFLLSKICHEAGLPAGVLNIVHGYGHKAGNAIVNHPDIKAISFTGGTKTGEHIAASAAPKFKKLSLELGGKNPVIIFEDCDFDAMIRETLRSSFSNQGQICLCGSRIFIQKSLYEKFRQAFVEKVSKMQVGDPRKQETKMGALVSEAHLEKVKSYIRLAQEEGGRVLCGGESPQMPQELSKGYYLNPTVIEGLPPHCRTNQEEIFGPVVSMMPFETEEEAINMANGVGYGLASVIWTENLNKAHRVAAKMESGIVWINCWLVRDLRTPFGGVKNSGVGREGGFEALRFFTEAKNVCLRIGEPK